MKVLKKILAFFLVFVTLFCSFSIFALADGEGYTYTGDSFWGWLLGNNTPDWLDSVVGFISSDYCEKSPNHFHTANSYLRKTNFWESVGSLGVYDYECQCEYCGDTFYVSQQNVAEIFHDSYDSYVNDTVKEELGTTRIGLNGFYIPLPVRTTRDFGNNRTFHVDPSSFGLNFSITLLTPSNSRGEFLISFDLGDSLVPFSGKYSVIADLVLDNCVTTGTLKTDVNLIEGQRLANTDIFYQYPKSDYFYAAPFSVIDTSSFAHVSGSYYLYCVPYSYSYLDFTSSIGGPSSRPSSVLGDLGIMGDNGTLTKIDGDQIFNEETNTYYNPVTNTTTNITDWSFDYSDRSYNLTTETGDTITVTYGDENITVNEGDTTYNVYYIIEGNAADVGSDGHYHQWGQPTRIEPSCTAPGSETYTCSVCGETKSTQIPALGHTWKIVRTVPTKYDDSGALEQEGYTLYECERCGEQYKSIDGTGPPGGGGSSDSGSGGGGTENDDGESIWDKLGNLLGSLGSGLLELIGAVVGKLLDGLISLADMIAEKLLDVVNLVLSWFDEIPKLFSGFLGFLTAIFPFLPPDIMLLLTFGIAAIVFIGIIKAVRR